MSASQLRALILVISFNTQLGMLAMCAAIEDLSTQLLIVGLIVACAILNAVLASAIKDEK